MFDLITNPEAIDARTAAARHQAMLAELSGISMDLARDMGRRALEADGADEAVALSSCFAKLARTVRQTITLETQVLQERSVAELAAAEAKRLERETRAVANKAVVQSAVRWLISNQMRSGKTRNGLDADDMRERLEHEDLSDMAYGDKPVGELLAMIAKDLKLNINWPAWRWKSWAREELEQRPPGSPFANGVPPPLQPEDLFTNDIKPKREPIGEPLETPQDTEPVFS